MMAKMQAQAFPGLVNHPSFSAPRTLDPVSTRVPVFSDNFGEDLMSGIIESVVGISAFSGPRSVQLTDGSVLKDIDVVVLCSGYEYDFSLVPADADPTNPACAPDGYKLITATPYYNPSFPFARLYRGFLSTSYPESLAFLGHGLITKPPFPLYDLVTMALAQLWTGGYPLPSAREINADVDQHYSNVLSLLQYSQVPHPGARIVTGGPTYLWLNEVAGTGVTHRLGNWGYEAWKFWRQDRKFYNLLMDGLDSPHVYRLFDTSRGRKAWSGARQAIEKANADVKEMEQAWKENQVSKRESLVRSERACKS